MFYYIYFDNSQMAEFALSLDLISAPTSIKIINQKNASIKGVSCNLKHI